MIKKRFKFIIIVILLIILSVYIYKNIKENIKENSKPFIEFINIATTEPYTIHENSTYSSSGGGRFVDNIREVNSDELKNTINEIKNLPLNNSFLAKNKVFGKNKKCFYSLNSFTPQYQICFLDNKIVDYMKSDGPSRFSWYVEGYEKNKRSTIINSISDLQSCNIDSDCTLETEGVCIPKKNQCSSNDANCDSGYRLSINNKYSFIWGGVEYDENKCIKNNTYASYEKSEYYKAICIQNKCEPSVIKDKVNSTLPSVLNPSPIVDNKKMINARGETVDKFVTGNFKIIDTREIFEYQERYNPNPGDSRSYNSNAVNDCITKNCKIIYFENSDYNKQKRVALFNDKDNFILNNKLIRTELISYQYSMIPDTGEIFPIVQR